MKHPLKAFVRTNGKHFQGANTCSCPSTARYSQPHLIQSLDSESSICSTKFYFLLLFIPMIITVVHEITVTFLNDSSSPHLSPTVKEELQHFITFIQRDTTCNQGQRHQSITFLKANIIFLFVVLKLQNYTDARTVKVGCFWEKIQEKIISLCLKCDHVSWLLTLDNDTFCPTMLSKYGTSINLFNHTSY